MRADFSMGRFCVVLCVVIVLGGCASYTPNPISVDHIQNEMNSRSLDGETLAVASQRLREQPLFSGMSGEIEPADGLSFEELFLVGLAYSPRLNELRARLGEYEGLIVSAGAIGHVNLEGKIGENGDRWQGDGNAKTDVLSLMNLVKRPVRRAAAEAEYQMAELMVLEAEWKLYVEMRSLCRKLQHHFQYEQELRQRIGDYEKSVLQIALELAKHQRIPQDDAKNAEIMVEKLNLKLDAIVNRTRLLEEEIRELAGLPPALEVIFQREMESERIFPMGLFTLLSRIAFDNRVDMQVLLARYEVAERQLKLAVMDQYPDIAFGPAGSFGSMDDFVGGAVKLKLPVFYQNQGEIVRREARREAMYHEAEALLLGIQHGIQESLRWLNYYDQRMAQITDTLMPAEYDRMQISLNRMRFEPAVVGEAAQQYFYWLSDWIEIKELQMQRLDWVEKLERATGMRLERIHYEDK